MDAVPTGPASPRPKTGWGLMRRASCRSWSGPIVMLAAALLVSCSSSATPGATKGAPIAESYPARVAVYGDSLALQAEPYFKMLMAAADQSSTIYYSSFVGTAICDWLPRMRRLAVTTHLEAVMLEFSGNATTSCMAGIRYGTPAYYAEYRADTMAALSIWVPAGVHVFLVGAPVTRGGGGLGWRRGRARPPIRTDRGRRPRARDLRRCRRGRRGAGRDLRANVAVPHRGAVSRAGRQGCAVQRRPLRRRGAFLPRRRGGRIVSRLLLRRLPLRRRHGGRVRDSGGVPDGVRAWRDDFFSAAKLADRLLLWWSGPSGGTCARRGDKAWRP